MLSKYSEKEAEVEKLQDMLVFHGRALPSNAVSYEELVGALRSRRRRSKTTRPLTPPLYASASAIAGRRNARKGAERDQRRESALSRAGRGDRVPGVWIPGKGAAALVVAPEGAKAARASSAVRDLLAAKRPVLLIDAFQTGSAVAPRKEGDFFLTFNRSNDANRVQDILTGLAFLRSSGAGDVELIGLGKAAVWSLFAAAVSDTPVRLTADLGGFNGSDQDFIDRFSCPVSSGPAVFAPPRCLSRPLTRRLATLAAVAGVCAGSPGLSSTGFVHCRRAPSTAPRWTGARCTCGATGSVSLIYQPAAIAP